MECIHSWQADRERRSRRRRKELIDDSHKRNGKFSRVALTASHQERAVATSEVLEYNLGLSSGDVTMVPPFINTE